MKHDGLIAIVILVMAGATVENAPLLSAVFVALLWGTFLLGNARENV